MGQDTAQMHTGIRQVGPHLYLNLQTPFEQHRTSIPLDLQKEEVHWHSPSQFYGARMSPSVKQRTSTGVQHCVAFGGSDGTMPNRTYSPIAWPHLRRFLIDFIKTFLLRFIRLFFVLHRDWRGPLLLALSGSSLFRFHSRAFFSRAFSRWASSSSSALAFSLFTTHLGHQVGL